MKPFLVLVRGYDIEEFNDSSVSLYCHVDVNLLHPSMKRYTCHHYPELYEKWLILFEYHDPLEIVETLLGEREPEVIEAVDVPFNFDTQIQWILPRLPTFDSPDDLRRAIHAEFARWFHPEIIGVEQRVAPLAREAWASYERNRADICM